MNELGSKGRGSGRSRDQREEISYPYTLSGSVLVCILLLTMPASAADPCAPLGFQTGNRCIFAVAANDVGGLVAAIQAANSVNKSLLSSDIVLEGGTYTVRRLFNTVDGPAGLPSITGVITISTGTVDRSKPAIIERSRIGASIERNRNTSAREFRIFHVSSNGALALIGVDVSGGAGISGGGLFNRGPIALVINSRIFNNDLIHDFSSQGGGIYNGGDRPGVLVLAGSEVKANVASNGGGGIFTSGPLIITDSTIDGNINLLAGGGGIRNDGSSVVLEHSTVSNNRSGGGTAGTLVGGGIFNHLDRSTLSIADSTISGNSTPSGNGRGGGINNEGTLALRNVTIANNVAQNSGAGISNVRGSRVMLANTIIGGNCLHEASDLAPFDCLRAGFGFNDCDGTLTSHGFNLLGTEEDGQVPPSKICHFVRSEGDRVFDQEVFDQAFKLPPLPADFLTSVLSPLSQDGLTATHHLPENSPAIGSGDHCLTTDQRRFLRVGSCDIGAFEHDAVSEVLQIGPARTLIREDTMLDQNQSKGIVIGTDGIVLDCNHRTITGNRIGAGIELKGRKNVTVRNCTVTNFHNGFNIEDSTLNIFVNNTVIGNGNDGFHIARSTGSIFDHNISGDNGDDGFDVNEGKANLFTSNMVQGNQNKGFNVDSSLGNFFIDNTSDANTDRGFRVSQGSRYNAFVGNAACHNNNDKARFDFEENSNPNFFRGNVFCSAGRIPNSERF